MNLYGDLGNVITLKNRCEWRDIEFEVVDVKIGTEVDFADADIIFMGGGQDRGQTTIGNDLLKRKHEIQVAVESGTVALTICGGFQLFGKYFKTIDGTEIPGIEVFDAHTIGGEKRLIGNVVVDIAEEQSGWPEKNKEPRSTLVGFENHSGQTHLGRNTKPLGYIKRGYGNLGDGGAEGAVYKNAYGTYLHGSLLPKNPHFADHLIRAALKKRYNVDFPLEPLNDELELLAHDRAIERAETAKTISI